MSLPAVLRQPSTEPPQPAPLRHGLANGFRESITTLAFLAAIGAETGRRGHFDAEVLRAEFDAGGHDLVVTANGATRHIQLKTTNLSSKRASWDTSMRLAEQPSGCVVVQCVDDQNLQVRKYGLFAGPPGHPLPDSNHFRATKHTKGDSAGQKAVRKGRWEVSKGQFKTP